MSLRTAQPVTRPRSDPIQIACSQALALDFLPSHIAAFQKKHPKVLFDLRVIWPSLRVIASIPQWLVVIVRSDHPLAAKKTVRLSECAEYPAAVPDRTLSGRQILD